MPVEISSVRADIALPLNQIVSLVADTLVPVPGSESTLRVIGGGVIGCVCVSVGEYACVLAVHSVSIDADTACSVVVGVSGAGLARS